MSAFRPGPALPPRPPHDDDPAVTVVLPTFRRRDVLPRAMTSVLQQTYGDFELIVVDDEPSDETRAVALGTGDARVRYVAHAHNLGLPAARNTGIRHGRGRFFGFVDDDDEWRADKLELQVRLLDASGPGVGVATCFQTIADAARGHTRLRAVRTDGDVLSMLLRNDAVNAQVMLIRREILERVGLFVEEQHWLEDYELTLRLAAATRFVTWPEPGVTMHRSPESMSTSGLERRITGWRLVIERHGEAAGRLAKARWLTKIARLHAQTGNRRAWRTTMAAAIRTNPTSAAIWGLAAVGWVGGPASHARLARWRGRRREGASTV